MYTQAHKRAVLKYYKTAKGKECLRKYHQTPKFREYMRNYQRSRAWYYKRKSAEKEARERGATVGDAVEITKIYKRCEWWRQWFDVCVDHIIPFSRGGTHELQNMQIIYQFENVKKRARLDYKPSVIFV